MAELYISELKKTRCHIDAVIAMMANYISVLSVYGKIDRKTILDTLVHVYTLARDIDRYIEIVEREAEPKIDCAQIMLRIERRSEILMCNVARWLLTVLDWALDDLSRLDGPKAISTVIDERCALAEFFEQIGPKLREIDEKKIKPIASLT